MTLENGTLEITGGSMVNAASFTALSCGYCPASGKQRLHQCQGRGYFPRFHFRHAETASVGVFPAVLPRISISAADSFTLGGSVGILDNGVSADYFYADNSWAQKRVFIVLTDSDKTHEGDFSGPYSLATDPKMWIAPMPTRAPGATNGWTRTATAFPNSSSLSGRPRPGKRTFRGIARAGRRHDLELHVVLRLQRPRHVGRRSRQPGRPAPGGAGKQLLGQGPGRFPLPCHRRRPGRLRLQRRRLCRGSGPQGGEEYHPGPGIRRPVRQVVQPQLCGGTSASRPASPCSMEDGTRTSAGRTLSW